jgi:hypothetical protein
MNEKIDKFIELQVNLINKGFELSQIRKDTWRFCLKEFANILVLEAIIDTSMQIYENIILKVERQLE